MNTQTKIKLFTLYYSVGTSRLSNPLPGQPGGATSLDYGFDFDEQELGQELAAPPPGNIADSPAPLIAADEFESLYKWFISYRGAGHGNETYSKTI